MRRVWPGSYRGCRGAGRRGCRASRVHCMPQQVRPGDPRTIPCGEQVRADWASTCAKTGGQPDPGSSFSNKSVGGESGSASIASALSPPNTSTLVDPSRQRRNCPREPDLTEPFRVALLRGSTRPMSQVRALQGALGVPERCGHGGLCRRCRGGSREPFKSRSVERSTGGTDPWNCRAACGCSPMGDSAVSRYIPRLDLCTLTGKSRQEGGCSRVSRPSLRRERKGSPVRRCRRSRVRSPRR